ncbi:MAG: NADH dehydrogenase FAD-containing subunit [Deltaproteobacteria bacterium]|nr:NADH dehydrogenase FAD-containing subunit [Deltaproteobacteria bacterium]
MLFALLLLPVLAGGAAFLIRPNPPRRALLLATALGHAGFTALAWLRPPAPAWDGWLRLDAPGLLFLAITSGLFLAVAFYAWGYLRREDPGRRQDFEQGLTFKNTREAIFTGCLLEFLGMMTLVTVSQHLGLLWVAVEATTLVSAPLIYFHRHKRSLEATWKYLMICSVGIALALLGNFCLSVAAAHDGGGQVHLLLDSLLTRAPGLDAPWLRAAFLFLLVGYGTKMGLAPLHTWLPDAHSEAPSLISALLSGALLNCAFLAIFRVQQVMGAAGQAEFGQNLLLGFGLLSMAVAGAFIIGQADYKRLLAYSSVEHMGILAFALGLGGAAGVGAMLHAVNHSLTKGMLFLAAGNILALYQSKSTGDIRGVARMLPVSGVLWAAGFLAITGSPPFGAFLSELMILQAALAQGRPLLAVAFLLLLCLVFVGMGSAMLRMVQGQPAGLPAGMAPPTAPAREPWLAVLPPLCLGAGALTLGLWIPASLWTLLEQAGGALGAR